MTPPPRCIALALTLLLAVPALALPAATDVEDQLSAAVRIIGMQTPRIPFFIGIRLG